MTKILLFNAKACTSFVVVKGYALSWTSTTGIKYRARHFFFLELLSAMKWL